MNHFLKDDLRAGTELLKDTHRDAYDSLREAIQADYAACRKNKAKRQGEETGSLLPPVVVLLIALMSLLSLFFPQQAQAQKLVGAGSSVTLQKADINRDQLSKAAEVKVREVKNRVFRNMMVYHFNEWQDEETSPLKNFTTYNYSYQLMDALTSGRSGTGLTKEIGGYLVEYAYVYAFARYLKASHFAGIGGTEAIITSTTASALTTPQTESFVTAVAGDKTNNHLQDVQLKDAVEKDDPTFTFNLTLDYAYAVILAYQKQNPGADVFKLSIGLDDAAFNEWYEEDNIYHFYVVSDPTKLNDEDKKIYNNNPKAIQALRSAKPADATAAYLAFKKLAESSKEIVTAIAGVKKGRRLETIKPEEFQAMKLLLGEFTERFRGTSYRNVVTGVLEIIVDNLQQEPVDPNLPEGNGYFYVDVESVIATVFDKFARLENRRALKYVSLVGNIGFNYLNFVNSPTLRDDAGERLNDLYLASEKLGVKWKVWNYGYTHSILAGQSYSYYGVERTPVHQWKQPLISDIHLQATASGILYNLLDTKTNKNFSYGLLQGGVGFTFFNGLSLDAAIGSPFTKRAFRNENLFYSLSIDIPLLDYILAGRQK